MKQNNCLKIILHLCCSDSGSDSLPYQRAGYTVIKVTKDVGVENYHPPENVYGIIANPPCTMFSLARTRAKTPRDLKEGMFLVKECLRIIWEAQYNYDIKKHGYFTSLKFWVLENPYGFLRFFLGKPVMTYQPYEFGEEYSKKTCLWGYFNKPVIHPLFNNSPTLDLFHHGTAKDIKRVKSISDIHNNPRTRQELRSVCSKKFAQAFFEENR